MELHYALICCIFCLMIALLAPGRGAEKPVLVAGGQYAAYAEAFASLRVRVETASLDQAARMDLSRYSAVLVCAENYKAPTILKPSFQSKLESYARSGRMVVAEYVLPAEGRRLFGVSLDRKGVFARHERIIVSRALFGTHDTSPGALLDEQYSYVLPALDLPTGSERLLDYGMFIGTYEAQEPPARLRESHPDLGVKKRPALLRVPFGKGSVLILTTKFGDHAQRHYRLASRWREIVRGICLEALPPALRRQAAARYVPLAACTDPRRWAPTGSSAELVVETSADAAVSARCASLRIGRLKQQSRGVWRAAIEAAPGKHSITVTARTAGGRARTTVALWVASRRAAYLRALGRSMAWFRGSGIMPREDGGAGVYSTIFVPSPDDGPQENLPGPIRTDCLAMVADAFLMFAQISGDGRWTARARNLGDMLIKYQRVDSTRADYGSFPWIIGRDGAVKDESIWFHDNESRVAAALLNLYAHTGDTRYLQAGLRSMQLALDVSREDYTIGNHSTIACELNRMGRTRYRELANYTIRWFDMLRWFRTYAVTGDQLYRNAAQTVAGLYHDGRYTASIAPYACRLVDEPGLAAQVEAHFAAMLKEPDIARYGVRLTRGPGSYEFAYQNDCSINTGIEPLSDQLYMSPISLREAWFAYKGAGSASALKVFTNLADYLVRIQLEDSSPKVNGCWVRGFDPERWEDYGAPYDPNYGPYHAYSGWMNSVIGETLAFYLADSDPFELHRELWTRSAAFVEESRKIRPPDEIGTRNLALGKPYTVSPAPEVNPEGALTDGVIDNRSVVWRMPELGNTLDAQVTIDLGGTFEVAMVGVRMGDFKADFNADKLTIEIGPDLDHMSAAASVPCGPAVDWSAWKSFKPASGRFVRLTYSKTRSRASQDKLALGDITVLGKAH